MTIEIKITGCNRQQIAKSVVDLAEAFKDFAVYVETAVEPDETPVAPVKRARKPKLELAEEIVVQELIVEPAPEAAPEATAEPVDNEALKEATIARLREKYLTTGGKADVKKIIEDYGQGETAFTKMKAELFPAIAAALDALDAAEGK